MPYEICHANSWSPVLLEGSLLSYILLEVYFFPCSALLFLGHISPLWCVFYSCLPLAFCQVATEADLGLADAYINGYFSFADQREGLLNLFLVKLHVLFRSMMFTYRFTQLFLIFIVLLNSWTISIQILIANRDAHKSSSNIASRRSWTINFPQNSSEQLSKWSIILEYTLTNSLKCLLQKLYKQGLVDAFAFNRWGCIVEIYSVTCLEEEYCKTSSSKYLRTLWSRKYPRVLF